MQPGVATLQPPVAVFAAQPAETLGGEAHVGEFGGAQLPPRRPGQSHAPGQALVAPGAELVPGGGKRDRSVGIAAHRANQPGQLFGSPGRLVALALRLLGPPPRPLVLPGSLLCRFPGGIELAQQGLRIRGRIGVRDRGGRRGFAHERGSPRGTSSRGTRVGVHRRCDVGPGAGVALARIPVGARAERIAQEHHEPRGSPRRSRRLARDGIEGKRLVACGCNLDRLGDRHSYEHPHHVRHRFFIDHPIPQNQGMIGLARVFVEAGPIESPGTQEDRERFADGVAQAVGHRGRENPGHRKARQ